MPKRNWKIDPSHTSVEFAVKHLMFTTVRGRFKNLDGVLDVSEEAPEQSSVAVEIDASSLDTGAEDRDAHLVSGDFLDVQNHPKIIFRSKRIVGAHNGAHYKEGDRFKVIGDLSIRGETMEVELDTMFEGQGLDPWGNKRAGFSAKTEIDRRDWGLRWNQTLETGGVLVGNKVSIDLDIQAVCQET